MFGIDITVAYLHDLMFINETNRSVMFNKLLMILLLLSMSDAYAASPAVTFGCPGYDTSKSQECYTHSGNENYVDIYQRSSLESLSTKASVFANYSIAFFRLSMQV
jgi:hypothetical protein